MASQLKRRNLDGVYRWCMFCLLAFSHCTRPPNSHRAVHNGSGLPCHALFQADLALVIADRYERLGCTSGVSCHTRAHDVRAASQLMIFEYKTTNSKISESMRLEPLSVLCDNYLPISR